MTAAILSRRGPPQGSLRDEAKLVESHVPSLRMTAIRALTARCLRHAHCAERYAARGKVVRWRDTESSLDLGHSVMRSVLTPCQLLALDRCSQIVSLFIIRGMLIILLHRGSVGTDAIAYISRDGWVGLFHNARSTLRATPYSLLVSRVMYSRRFGRSAGPSAHYVQTCSDP